VGRPDDDADEEEGDDDDEAGGGADGEELEGAADSAVALRKAVAARKAAARAAAAAALPRGVRRASAPYMTHALPGRPVASVRFKPYDDILAVGTALGLCSMIVPGAGEANPDSREADPHQEEGAAAGGGPRAPRQAAAVRP